jgi:phytoene synthase
MTPDDYWIDSAGSRGSSLYYSLLFAPPDRRRAVIALHAFAAEVDEIVDNASDPVVAQTKFSWWHEELVRLYEGKARHPITQVLAPALSRYALRQEQFLSILHENAAAYSRTRYPDFETLRTYALGTGGTTASMTAAILGATDPATLRSAEQLGTALKLTQTIQHLGRDVDRHLYLPANDLQRFGVTDADLAARRGGDGFSNLLEFEIGRIASLYDEALRGLPAADRAAQLPIVILANIARAELDELGRDGYRVLEHRVALTPIRKLWIAWRTRFTERRYRQT